jgi:hypothetical protein
MPITSTAIVLLPAPFHSFRMIPQMLLKAMFIDIRMLQAKAIMETGSLLSPIPMKKNCRYHKVPPMAEKMRLLTSTEEETDK